MAAFVGRHFFWRCRKSALGQRGPLAWGVLVGAWAEGGGQGLARRGRRPRPTSGASNCRFKFQKTDHISGDMRLLMIFLGLLAVRAWGEGPDDSPFLPANAPGASTM